MDFTTAAAITGQDRQALAARTIQPEGFSRVPAVAVAEDLIAQSMARAAEREARYAKLAAEEAAMLATAADVAASAPVTDDTPAAQRIRARAWAVAEHIRSTLAATDGPEFTDAELLTAGNIAVEFPTAWTAYAPFEGPNHCLLAYKGALRELADPLLTVARLESAATSAFTASKSHLASAAEHLGRMTWASADPDQLIASARASVACAAGKLEEAASFRARAAAVVGRVVVVGEDRAA